MYLVPREQKISKRGLCQCSVVLVSITCKVAARDRTSDILGLMGEEILPDKLVTVTEL